MSSLESLKWAFFQWLTQDKKSINWDLSQQKLSNSCSFKFCQELEVEYDIKTTHLQVQEHCQRARDVRSLEGGSLRGKGHAALSPSGHSPI